MSEKELKLTTLENLINQVEYRLTLCGRPSTAFEEYSKINEAAKELYFKGGAYSDLKFNPLFDGLTKNFSELESRLKDVFESIESRRSQQQPKTELLVKAPDQEGQATFKLSRGGERAGSGRKKKEGMTARKISLSLPDDWWQHIDEMKDQHNMTQSDVLHNLIIPILAITSGGYNTNFIKSEGDVMNAIEKYFRK